MDGTEKGAAPLAAFGRVAAAATRRMGLALASSAMAEAMAEGRWIAISDASVGKGGGAYAYGIYDPMGRLAACGAKKVSGKSAEASAKVEAMGQLAAMRALAGLGVKKAIAFMDNVKRPDSYVNYAQNVGLHRSFKKSGGFDLKRQWMPREGMGPANDAARLALGLPPEFGSGARAWEGWLEHVMGGAVLDELDNPKARRSKPSEDGKPESLGQLAPGRWVCAVSAMPMSRQDNALKAGYAFAIYDPQGRLADLGCGAGKAPMGTSRLHGIDLCMAAACSSLARLGASGAVFWAQEETTRRRISHEWFKQALASQLSGSCGERAVESIFEGSRCVAEPGSKLPLLGSQANQCAKAFAGKLAMGLNPMAWRQARPGDAALAKALAASLKGQESLRLILEKRQQRELAKKKGAARLAKVKGLKSAGPKS